VGVSSEFGICVCIAAGGRARGLVRASGRFAVTEGKGKQSKTREKQSETKCSEGFRYPANLKYYPKFSMIFSIAYLTIKYRSR